MGANQLQVVYGNVGMGRLLCMPLRACLQMKTASSRGAPMLWATVGAFLGGMRADPARATGTEQ